MLPQLGKNALGGKRYRRYKPIKPQMELLIFHTVIKRSYGDYAIRTNMTKELMENNYMEGQPFHPSAALRQDAEYEHAKELL